MLANQYITNHYPTLTLDDTVFVALQLMDDFEIQHLPVLSDELFLGLIDKDDLLDEDENRSLAGLENDLLRKAVKGGEHFLAALKLSASDSLSLVPVVDEAQHLLGVITQNQLLKSASAYTGAEESGAIIVLEMERKDFSFGEISRLVETNDAYVTQFNTAVEAETGLLIATIKINKMEVSDIIATFQRYEYVVRYFIGEEHYENEIRHNYHHLMTYLKI